LDVEAWSASEPGAYDDCASKEGIHQAVNSASGLREGSPDGATNIIEAEVQASPGKALSTVVNDFLESSLLRRLRGHKGQQQKEPRDH
jgi:hypothetical protein